MAALDKYKLLWVHLRRFSWRHVRRAPWTTGSLIAIVALGVAVFFSVRLSNRAAVAGFQLFTQSISGGSDFAVSGTGATLSADQLPNLRAALNPLPVMLLPIVEGTASLPGTGRASDDFDAAQVPVLGVDLLAVQNLAYGRRSIGYRPGREQQGDVHPLGDSESVLITAALAQRMNLQQGDRMEAVIGDRTRVLTIGSVLVPDDFQAGKSEELLIMDLPALQQLLQQPDRIDRVELIIPEGPSAERMRIRVEHRLQKLPKQTWIWATTDDQQDSARTMTGAFRLNLTILSALSLLVGIYLIIQAMEAAVVRRRNEIGTLLAMGCEPRWIQRAWLTESLLLGITGSGLGLVLGWIFAQGSVRAVAQTVNALYVSTTAEAAAWDPVEAWLAFSLGVLATVAAGVLPAKDAARTPPVQVMRRESRSEGIRLLDAPRYGLLLLLIGGLCSKMGPIELGPGTRLPLGGYCAATCWLIGAAILSSHLLKVLPQVFQSLARKNAYWRVATSQFRRPSGRQKLTVAGLVVAVGMASGMEILTHSFERSVTGWLNQALRADLFVAVKGIQNASSQNRISETVWRELMNDPTVDEVEIGHVQKILFREAPTMLMGIRSKGAWTDDKLIWAARPDETVQLDAARPDGRWPALISESFSTRYGLTRNDEIELPSPSGLKRIRILGVYADYGNERGVLLMDGPLLCSWYQDTRALNMAVTLKTGTDAARVREHWTVRHPGLAIRTNGALRKEVLTIFHQTFAVTNALKVIGVCVAISGLALALFSLLTDRRRELITLRELGFERRGIAKAVAIEGTLLSVIGLAGGLILSLALGYLLIFVINKQSFGWTLAYAVSAWSMALLAAGVLLAAVTTGYSIGHWAGQVKGEQSE